MTNDEIKTALIIQYANLEQAKKLEKESIRAISRIRQSCPHTVVDIVTEIPTTVARCAVCGNTTYGY